MKERIYKLVQHAAGRLRQTLDGRTRLLIFFLEPFSGKVQVCWPLNNVPELTEPSTTLVQNCFKRQRSVQVHDAKVDPLIGSLSGADFRCALCVPLFDKASNMMGVIYLDHPEVGALDKQERLSTERLARHMSNRIPKWTPADLATPQQDAPPPRVDPLSALILGGLLVFFVGAWVLAPEPQVTAPDPKATQTPVRQKTPEEVARSFMALLSLNEGKQVWGLLTPAKQEEVSSADLANNLRKWLSDPRVRWELQHRTYRTHDDGPDAASVFLDPPSQSEDGEPWELKLESVEGEWRIADFSEGLFSTRERSER